MKKRIKEKIFKNRHNPKLHYSINQILEATKFTIIWWRAAEEVLHGIRGKTIDYTQMRYFVKFFTTVKAL